MTVYQHETPDKLGAEGIRVITGSASFLDPHTIQVEVQRLRGKKFILSTGARAHIPSIPGLNNVPYWTYEQLFDNDKLPERLIVLGAGPVGTEMAQAYQRLGSQVTLIDLAILPLQDRGAAAVVSKVFAREGIRFVAGLATGVCQEGREITVHVGDREVRGDMLLVATGRRPNVSSLDLERAGVDYTDEGIRVNDALRTSAKHIYAAGDCIGGAQFTHLSGWHGFQAARNALLPGSESAFEKAVPSTIFTDPEVAQVGLTEAEAREQLGGSVRVAHQPMQRSDRAVCENDQDGFIKIIHKSNGKILGATIVGERAGELITEFILAIEYGLKMKDLATVLHAYPSYSMGTMRLAADVAMNDLATGVSGTVLRQLCKFA